ncbi:hypothetical protein Ae201684P_018340 [Aphanomyces euteiches]|nr:hypothetical protein Ae201684P_018340 [Aphanomyces euteiches]
MHSVSNVSATKSTRRRFAIVLFVKLTLPSSCHQIDTFRIPSEERKSLLSTNETLPKFLAAILRLAEGLVHLAQLAFMSIDMPMGRSRSVIVIK